MIVGRCAIMVPNDGDVMKKRDDVGRRRDIKELSHILIPTLKRCRSFGGDDKGILYLPTYLLLYVISTMYLSTYDSQSVRPPCHLLSLYSICLCLFVHLRLPAHCKGLSHTGTPTINLHQPSDHRSSALLINCRCRRASCKAKTTGAGALVTSTLCSKSNDL